MLVCINLPLKVRIQFVGRVTICTSLEVILMLLGNILPVQQINQVVGLFLLTVVAILQAMGHICVLVIPIRPWPVPILMQLELIHLTGHTISSLDHNYVISFLEGGGLWMLHFYHPLHFYLGNFHSLFFQFLMFLVMLWCWVLVVCFHYKRLMATFFGMTCWWHGRTETASYSWLSRENLYVQSLVSWPA